MYPQIKEFLKNLEFGEIITNVVINVGLIAAFISIFFFVYVIHVEKDIVNKQLEIITTECISSIKPFLNKKLINDILINLKKPNLSKEDEKIKKYNSELTNNAIRNILILFIITMIIGFFLCKYYNYNYYYIFGNNLILLVLIGITEYTFLHIIPVKYISGDSNYVNYKILVNLKNKLILK